MVPLMRKAEKPRHQSYERKSHVHFLSPLSCKEIWKIEGPQSKNGTDWKRAKISIKETGPYQLAFRATRGSQYLSDIGLDDIGMSHEACGEFDEI